MASKLPLIALLAASSLVLPACESNVEKYRNQGVRLYQQENYDQSLATLKKALSYDQSDSKSNTYAGLIYYRAGKYELAVYHFKLALQTDPSSEEAKEGLTNASIKLGKPDLALDFLERDAGIADKFDDPRFTGKHENRLKAQVDEAIYVGRAGNRFRIARTYEKLGDYDNAAVYYDKALELAPRNTTILMAKAGMYEKVGNKAKAREAYIRLYNIDPATPGLTEAMTRNNIAISQIIK